MIRESCQSVLPVELGEEGFDGPGGAHIDSLHKLGGQRGGGASTGWTRWEGGPSSSHRIRSLAREVVHAQTHSMVPHESWCAWLGRLRVTRRAGRCDP